MTPDDRNYPAVDRLQADLREDLLSAEEHGRSAKRSGARYRRFSRPLLVLGALVAIPATFAIAEIRSEDTPDFPEDQQIAIDRSLNPVLCPDGQPLVVDDVAQAESATCPDGSVPEGVVGVREVSGSESGVAPTPRKLPATRSEQRGDARPPAK